MVQQQITEAVSAALGAGAGAAAPAGAAKRPAGGQRLLVAMVSARETDCACPPCRLLREELKDLMDLMLKGMAEGAGSPDPQP